MNELAYNYEVFVGTYEHFLLSYKIKKPENVCENYLLQRVIAQKMHTSAIRCMANGGRYLATGGNDDRICILDLKLNREIQTLYFHTGNVNHLKFTPTFSHLLSVSDDGTLVATRAGSWDSENKWPKSHSNKQITHISIHPTGRLALTLGRDDTVRTWNLIKGQQCFTTNLKTLSSLGNTVKCIEWSPSGEYFAMANNTSVLILCMKTAAIYQEIRCENRPENICWLNNTTLLVGLCNGHISFITLGQNEQVIKEVHKNSRLKALDFVNYSDTVGILATVTSCGELSIWNVSIGRKKIKLLCNTNIECRPTCLVLVNANIYRKIDEIKIEKNTMETDGIAEDSNQKSPKKLNAGKVTVEVEEEEVGKEPTDDDATVETIREKAILEMRLKNKRKQRSSLSSRGIPSEEGLKKRRQTSQ